MRLRRIATVLLALVPSSIAGTQETGARSVADAGTEVTWAEHLAPVIFENCVQCHRPGEVAPFPLLTYKDARRRGRMMAKVTASGFMPPWHPADGHGEFVGDLRLEANQIALFKRWVESGMPEGDADRAPKPPQFEDGWMLGEPDLVVKMPRGFEVPADGPDIYRNFVIPLAFDEDRWITAIEVRPGSRRVLHHIIFQIDTTGSARQRDGADGKPGFRGMSGQSRDGLSRDGVASTSGLGGWAVGGMPRHLPMGLARCLPKGSDLVLASHLHPSGKAEVEQTTLAIHFADKPPERSMVGLQLPPAFGLTSGLDIPAGKADFELRDRFVVPVDVLGVTVGGHAHMVCRSMQLWVTRPGEKQASIFYIPEWDFDWQNRYQFAAPVALPAGSEVEAVIRYDNSRANPSNPFDPPRRIRWGQQSTDEMGSVTLLLVPEDEADTERLEKAVRDHARKTFRGKQARQGMMAAMVSRLWMNDANGDDQLSEDELPSRFRRYMMRADKNGDGVLTRDEVDALVDQPRRRR